MYEMPRIAIVVDRPGLKDFLSNGGGGIPLQGVSYIDYFDDTESFAALLNATFLKEYDFVFLSCFSTYQKSETSQTGRYLEGSGPSLAERIHKIDPHLPIAMLMGADVVEKKLQTLRKKGVINSYWDAFRDDRIPSLNPTNWIFCNKRVRPSSPAPALAI
jgi:hypothetical protein